MHLLLDSSGNFLVAGLAGDGDEIVAEAAHPTGTPASRDLSAVVEALLAQAGRPPLTGVIAGTGPGSFIGTRMAVSFANGLAAAAGCELRGVNSMAAIAAAAGPATAVLRDARQGQVYLLADAGAGTQVEVLVLNELAARIQGSGVAHVMLEAPRPGDAKGARRYTAIAETLAGVAAIKLVDAVPAAGLWRAGRGLSSQSYIEPEYLRGFL